jgi:hypothetical protein
MYRGRDFFLWVENMTRIETLLKILSQQDRDAKFIIALNTQTCISCGNPVGGFKGPSAKLEYKISGMCQTCQDYFFD